MLEREVRKACGTSAVSVGANPLHPPPPLLPVVPWIQCQEPHHRQKNDLNLCMQSLAQVLRLIIIPVGELSIQLWLN